MKSIRKKIISLLLWSQKYTKADMLYIGKNASWVGFGQTMNSILSLVLIIAFANMLPKETYGVYRYILSIAGILNIFTLTGMNSAVARTVARGDEGVLRPSVIYQLKWNMLMSVASIALSGYYFVNGDIPIAASLLILGIFVPATLAFNTYGSYLEGKKNFSLANITSILSTLFYSIGMLLTLFLTDSIILMISVYAATTFIASLISYIYILRRFKPTVHTEDITDTIKYGRELTYLRIIDPIVSQIDKVILAQLWGPAQLATYSLALAIPNRITLSIKGWVAIGFPKFAEKTPTEINTVFWKRIAQGMILGLAVALAYILIAPFLFTFLLPQYIDGIVYSQILAITLVLAIPNRYMSLLFTSQRLSYVLLKRTFIMSAVSIALYIVFGTWGGLAGLVFANTLIPLIGLAVNITMWRKFSKNIQKTPLD